MAESRRIEALAEKARADFLRRKSLRFLECAIELCLTDITPTQLAMILRQQAIIIEEFE